MKPIRRVKTAPRLVAVDAAHLAHVRNIAEAADRLVCIAEIERPVLSYGASAEASAAFTALVAAVRAWHA